MSLVSVVIPTLHRPKLILRALASVFSQTYEQLEVIVVIDGPDEDTNDVLRTVNDPRLHVIVNPRSLTAAGARNVGVDCAKGEWIAFLDDDDEWLPSKIEKQIAIASDRGAGLVSCLSRVVTPIATFVRPKVIYDNSFPLDEYLFDRRSLFAGSGSIQTSTYLMPRSLFDKTRFNVGTPHDDWDFILHLSKQLGLRIETVPEVLVVHHNEEQSLSTSGKWQESLVWIDSLRPIITRRAYSGFCLGVVGPRAAKERSYAAFFLLLYRAFRFGSPRIWRILFFIGFWLLPERAFETGRDRIWLAPWLRARGVKAYVIHPTNIPVSREQQRRAKSDGLAQTCLSWLAARRGQHGRHPETGRGGCKTPDP
jgi:glycosyltransferase involved in cell wall biosynthesis